MSGYALLLLCLRSVNATPSGGGAPSGQIGLRARARAGAGARARARTRVRVRVRVRARARAGLRVRR